MKNKGKMIALCVALMPFCRRGPERGEGAARQAGCVL